jgi:hypothetical protein
MTVRELRDILLKYECDGFGDTKIKMCHIDDNPGDSSCDFVSVLFMQWTNTNPIAENNKIVLMYE